MKICPQERNFHAYSSVSQGLVFLACGEYYMKTSTAILSTEAAHRHSMQTGGATHFKAVRLRDGQLCNFEDDVQTVEFPDAVIRPGREA